MEPPKEKAHSMLAKTEGFLKNPSPSFSVSLDSEEAAHGRSSFKTLTKAQFFLFLLISVFGIYHFSPIFPEQNNRDLEKDNSSAVIVSVADTPDPSQSPVQFPDPYLGMHLSAKAAYVFDVKRDISLFTKNENTVLPLASLTKLMTVLVAHDAMPEDTVIPIDQESLQIEGDSGLTIGEEWTLASLTDFTLVVSSNDGAHAIAKSAGAKLHSGGSDQDIPAFIRAMNAKAREIGLTGMRFNNESGLDVNESQSGGYGSAKDISDLFLFIMEHSPTLLEATRYKNLKVSSLDRLSHTVLNTSQSIDEIPDIIGSKTGFTYLAQGNLIVAFDAGINHPVIVVVLGSTFDGRFKDTQTLVKRTLQYLENN